MGWGVFTYVFGAICIGGPLLVAFWYAKAARRKFREFAASAAARDRTTEER